MMDRIRDTFMIARLMLQRRRTRQVVWISFAVYFLIFLLALGDLGFHEATGSFSTRWVRDPLALMFRQITPLRFEAIAVVEMSVATFLFAPLNLLFGSLLAFLVGLNLAFTYLAIIAPRICYGRPSVGIFASLPGLLAGFACCGPVILIILGVQASAAMVAFFGWLLPIAALLLLTTLWFNAGRTNIGYLEQAE